MEVKLPSISINEKIYEGPRTLVYRGIRLSDDQKVVIKLMRNEYPSMTELVQFRNQYAITKNLDLPGIVKSLSLEHYGNGYALVMEDTGGISLDKPSASFERIDLETGLKIGIQLAEILHGLYQNRIIHKDLKPANILIHPDTQEVKLIDFSIASLLPREAIEIQNPNQLEGTLAYISPEQTGRMNRGIDYRSDFYSLGVTLYELWEGELPFRSDDSMELVHSHLSKEPPALAKSTKTRIPSVISQIVMKLMGKNAEERYQSALGLKFDLEKCLSMWQETGSIEPFELGERDLSDRFSIPEKLYGREAEVQTLLDAFDRVANGKTEMMLVAGFSGIGKTAVVNEVHKPIVRQRGYFIKGKFDQFMRNIPFYALVQAFRNLIGQLLGESDARLSEWNAKILNALGSNAQVIIDVIPELERIIGKQPPAPELSGSAAQNRFNLLFQKFIGAIATAEHPLVVFVDDLQWADLASLKLMQLLMEDVNMGYLLLLGAYRDNEVFPAHPLMLTLDEIRKSEAALNTITLAPLSHRELNRLVADTLSCSLDIALPLTELVYQKTKGNPFFATQFLKGLYEDGWIVFNVARPGKFSDSVARPGKFSDSVARPGKFSDSVARPGKFSDSVARPGKFSDSDVALAEREEVVALAEREEVVALAEREEVVALAEREEVVALAERQELDVGYWQCDMTSVRQLALTDDVVEFMATRLHKLPEATRSILKLAACIGARFDLENLAIVSEQSREETASYLWLALKEGLILPLSETYKFYQGEGGDRGDKGEERSLSPLSPLSPHSQFPNYKFLHDRVQQAAYSLIPEAQKQVTHLQIGRLLWQNLSYEERKAQMFTIVNHYNEAIEVISQKEELDLLLELNIAAGQKAKGSAAYQAAWQYYQTALGLLPDDSWQRNYPSTLKLYEANAETAYLTGNFDRTEPLVEEVLSHAENVLDRVNVYDIKMQAEMAQSRLSDGLDTGVQFLALLGMKVPESVPPEDLLVEIDAISRATEGKSIADLAQLPPIEDANVLAKIKILVSLTTPTYQAKPDLYPWVICKLMQLSIEYGHTVHSAYTYSMYGFICILVLQNFPLASEYGQLACQLDLNPKTGDGVGGTMVTGGFLTLCYTHLKESLPLLLNAYQAGIETGNFQFGGYSIVKRPHHMYWMGCPLWELKQESATTGQALASLKQGNTLIWSQICEQAVLNLLGESEIPWELVGSAYDETQSLPLQLDVNDRTGLHFVYLHKQVLCYLFDRIPQAKEHAILTESYLDGVIGFLEGYMYNFYDSLIELARYNDAEVEMQPTIIKKVRDNQVKMQLWATHAPMNFQHKYDLVAAEEHRVNGERFQAMELYDRAIAGAKENEYIQEQALANELAAKLYLDWGKEKVAAGYMQEAYYCYARWGAKAKVDDLEKRYCALLKPILERQKLGLTPTATIATLTKGTISKTTTGTGQVLDLATLMKAAGTLSEDIELKGAIANLMQVAKENAGAETVALMLFQEEVLMLTALLAGVDAPKIDPIPVEASNAVPLSVVNQVKRLQKPLVSDNMSEETTFAGDAYIQERQPMSILCLPLIARGKLIGILYLENNRVAGAFTSDRQEVLNLLCSQAAISLENARLYEQSTDYAQKLESSLEELQAAQLQLIQSEKMSALGNLVAGVAHEINNPVGFIGGNLEPTLDYVHELFGLIDLYQQKMPSPDAELEAEIERIDLEFVRDDLLQIISAMQEGTERLAHISTSLRTFSRTDKEHKVPFQLQDGIESTLLILKHRLKANKERPEIEIKRNYEDVPQVSCYPGQLNQVFMNLLANAIDALEEGNAGRSFSEIKANPNRIAITTCVARSGKFRDSVARSGKFSGSDVADAERQEVVADTERQEQEPDRAVVKIADNGTGMPEAVKQRIFEQGFTTKAVGKGTGLGMAIALQIVCEKHDGTLTCSSEVGRGTEFCIAIPLIEDNENYS